MANPTTYFGWVMPTATDLVTDLPADFNVFGQGVDTSMQDLLGGTTGQVLSKTSGTNMDFTWVTPTDQTPLTTKGDLFTFTTVDARLGIGANNTVLTADSAQATGMKWATPAGGGKVLQVVMGTTATSTTITTTTLTATTLTATITPSSATSKVLVIAAQMYQLYKASTAAATGNYQLLRGASAILDNSNSFALGTETTTGQVAGTLAISYLDSPATTSATTYTTKARCDGATEMILQRYGNTSTIILMEIGA